MTDTKQIKYSSPEDLYKPFYDKMREIIINSKLNYIESDSSFEIAIYKFDKLITAKYSNLNDFKGYIDYISDKLIEKPIEENDKRYLYCLLYWYEIFNCGYQRPLEDVPFFANLYHKMNESDKLFYDKIYNTKHLILMYKIATNLGGWIEKRDNKFYINRTIDGKYKKKYSRE